MTNTGPVARIDKLRYQKKQLYLYRSYGQKAYWNTAIAKENSSIPTMRRTTIAPKEQQSDHVRWWTEFVEAEVSLSADDAGSPVMAERSDDDESDNKNLEIRLRTCTTRISRILRNDLPEPHRRIFYSTIETSMAALINHTADLSVIVRGLMLYLTRRGLLIDKNSQTLSDDFEEVCPNGIIPVSPIPSDIHDLKNITDLKTLFRRPHVQYLHARYLSKQSNTKEDAKHIFWHYLHNVQFDNMPNAVFAGLSRIHLVPKREASHIEMVTRMANIKKEGVKSVCVNHGIEFQDILNVIPNGLTRLFGPLQEKSEGGAGLSISGNIMIDRRAVGGPADVVLEDDTNLEIFSEWAKAGTVGGNQFWLQLNHPGEQIMANIGQPALAPSEVHVTEKNASLFAPPQEITEAQIQKVIDRFQYTSQLAERAGFTGVQIHAAHGYLLSQFLSPISNVSDDKWSGSLENRARLLFEVDKKVRSVVSPKFCVAVKINSADFQRDLVELSGGSYDSPAMFGEAKHTLQRSTIPIMVTGGISRREVLEQVMKGGVSMAGIATALILKPDLPNDFKNDGDPHPQLPTISWKNKQLRVLLKLSYINYQLVSVANDQKVYPNIWPSWALMKQVWFTVFRSRKYRQQMKSYTYKGPVTPSEKR
ncbi:unnamed protein product [Umbelopsis vinacea]